MGRVARAVVLRELSCLSNDDARTEPREAHEVVRGNHEFSDYAFFRDCYPAWMRNMLLRQQDILRKISVAVG